MTKTKPKPKPTKGKRLLALLEPLPSDGPKITRLAFEKLTVDIVSAISTGNNVVSRVFHAYGTCKKSFRDYQHEDMVKDSEAANTQHALSSALSQAAKMFGSDEAGFKDIAIRVGKGMRLIRTGHLEGYDKIVEDSWEAHFRLFNNQQTSKLKRACRPGHGALYKHARDEFYELANTSLSKKSA